MQIRGLRDELTEAVRSALTLTRYVGRDVRLAQVRRELERADAQIRRALEPFGYYSPVVSSDLESRNDTLVATLRVDPGQPVIVRSASVVVPEPAARYRVVREAVAAFEPRAGDRLVHATYEASKARIATALRSLGFVDAETTTARVEVSVAEQSAAIEVVYDVGERYRFGAVSFSGLPLSEAVVRRYIPWKPGDPYSVTEVLDLQERLAGTGYFESVSVQPDIEAAKGESIPIDVTVVPAARTVYSAGLFVSTDHGPGGKLGIDTRWANRRGHSWSTEIAYASNEQHAAVSYRIPRPGSGMRALRIGGAYENEETDTSTSQSGRAVVAQTRARWYGFNRSLGVQYLLGSFDFGDETRTSNLLYADISLSRTRADDLLFPRRGHSLTLGLRAAPAEWLSDTRFVQLRANARLVRAVGPDTRLLMHAATGAMSVDDFDALPPDLRFFAGGDRSVRGFDFEAIGETDEDGNVIGGEYLATGGIELEHYIWESWGLAAFVDAGDAFRSGFDLNVGAGVGLRWRSPVGVVRLDVARAVRTELDDGWRIHLVIGPDL